MKSSFRNVGLALAAMLLAVVTAYGAKSETFTGEVSDAMCGAKHATADKAACTSRSTRSYASGEHHCSELRLTRLPARAEIRRGGGSFAYRVGRPDQDGRRPRFAGRRV